MEDLRKYIIILEQIEDLLEELPTLNFDTEIENFYENTIDKVIEHRFIMEKRLKNKEKEIMKVGV